MVGEVGLRNGAFYGHFASKDDPVRESIEKELIDQETLVGSIAESDKLEGVFRCYLSVIRRDNPATGCPSAALLEESGRRPVPVRDAYNSRVVAVADALAPILDRGTTDEARVDALVIYGILVSAIQLARAVTDARLSDQILENAMRAATLLASPRNRTNTTAARAIVAGA